MTRELYNVYNRMFDNCAKLEDHVRSVLTKNGWKVYHVEIHVGKEETEEYVCYIEYTNSTYHYLNGTLLTEEQIYQRFKEVETLEETKFIVWYRYEGEEDYMIITAVDEAEARRKFYGWHSEGITDIHEIEDSELYLAYL